MQAQRVTQTMGPFGKEGALRAKRIRSAILPAPNPTPEFRECGGSSLGSALLDEIRQDGGGQAGEETARRDFDITCAPQFIASIRRGSK